MVPIPEVLMPAYPRSVKMLADVIGDDLAAKLIRNLPPRFARGRQLTHLILYVPKKLPVTHNLVRWIGYDAAAKLSREFRGEILTIATRCSVDRADRDREIVARLKDREAVEIVAAEYGLSVRQVRRIASAQLPDATQKDSRSNSLHALAA